MSHTTEKIDGREVTLSVSAESGVWTVTLNHDQIASGMTRDDVLKKARKALRTAALRVKIPASLMLESDDDKPARVEHIVITGLHARNGNVLMTNVESGEKKQHDGYWDGIISERLSDEDAAEFVRLDAVKQAAERAYNEFVDQHKVNGEELVKEQFEKSESG